MPPDPAAATTSLQDILNPISAPLDRLEGIVEDVIRSREDLMTEIVEHVRGFRGKRLRPAMVCFGALCSGRPVEEAEGVVELAAITEMIHTVTLIHDDIIDRADTRRKHATFNNRWDNQVAVIFGDYMFSKAFSLTLELPDAHVRSRIAQVVSDLCEGEIKQLEGRNNVHMDEETYYDMILLKTATFLGCCSGMGARLAGMEGADVEKLERVGERLGCAFQIVDDCLDIAGDEGDMGKSLGTDVATGKFTLPLIKLLGHLSEQDFTELKALFAAGEGYKAKERIFRLVHDTGSLDEAWAEARRFTDDALGELEQLPDNAGRQGLEKLAHYLVQRNH